MKWNDPRISNDDRLAVLDRALKTAVPSEAADDVVARAKAFLEFMYPDPPSE